MKVLRRVVLALLLIAAAAYLSPVLSGRAAENRVADSIAAMLRQHGYEPLVYVWPSAAPDTVSILERNGVGTRPCTDTEGRSCFPQVYLYRSTADGLFETRVRWQYSRDHHGVGGTRRFFGVLGWVRELKPDSQFIQ